MMELIKKVNPGAVEGLFVPPMNVPLLSNKSNWSLLQLPAQASQTSGFFTSAFGSTVISAISWLRISTVVIIDVCNGQVLPKHFTVAVRVFVVRHRMVAAELPVVKRVRGTVRGYYVVQNHNTGVGQLVVIHDVIDPSLHVVIGEGVTL